MREERPRSWCWGVFGSKVRSAAQGPSCLGGARGSVRSVYTPPSLLPQTCQLGMVTASTASPGCQFCFVTWVSVTASLNLSFLPWNVGITPPRSREGYMVGDATLIPALAVSKNPRGVSALPRGGHPWPKPGRTPGGRALGVGQGWLRPGRLPGRTLGEGGPSPARLLSHSFPALPAPRERGEVGGDRGRGGEPGEWAES